MKYIVDIEAEITLEGIEVEIDDKTFDTDIEHYDTARLGIQNWLSKMLAVPAGVGRVSVRNEKLKNWTARSVAWSMACSCGFQTGLRDEMKIHLTNKGANCGLV